MSSLQFQERNNTKVKLSTAIWKECFHPKICQHGRVKRTKLFKLTTLKINIAILKKSMKEYIKSTKRKLRFNKKRK